MPSTSTNSSDSSDSSVVSEGKTLTTIGVADHTSVAGHKGESINIQKNMEELCRPGQLVISFVVLYCLLLLPAIMFVQFQFQCDADSNAGRHRWA